MESSARGEFEQLSLVVSFVLFTSPDSDYAVIKGTDPQKRQVCVAGRLGKPWKGHKLEVVGQWVHHPKFGKQFAGNAIGLEPAQDFNQEDFP